MTREFRSHAFHSLLEGMHSAVIVGRQALRALDVIHVAFAEDRGSWRGTDHYADKLDEGVRRLAFEVRLRRGDEAEDRVPCATKREVKVRGTPVFAVGTLLAVVGYIDVAGKRVGLAGPDFKGKPSWQEVQVACKGSSSPATPDRTPACLPTPTAPRCGVTARTRIPPRRFL